MKRRSKILTLLLLSSAAPAVACGTCATDSFVLNMPFVIPWFYLAMAWLVAVTFIRLKTKTLTASKVIVTLCAIFGAFFLAAAILGPLVLFVFVAGWFKAYLGLRVPKTDNGDPAARPIKKLGHFMLVGLIGSVVVGMTLDHFNPEYRRLSRGMGGLATNSYCIEIVEKGLVTPAELIEMTNSDNSNLKRNAYLALSESKDVRHVPVIIQGLQYPEVSGKFLANRRIRSNLEKLTCQDFESPKEWSQWWEAEGEEWLEMEIRYREQ